MLSKCCRAKKCAQSFCYFCLAPHKSAPCWCASVFTFGTQKRSLSAHHRIQCWRTGVFIVASVGAQGVLYWRTSVFTVAAKECSKRKNDGRSRKKTHICFWLGLRSASLCSYDLFGVYAGTICPPAASHRLPLATGHPPPATGRLFRPSQQAMSFQGMLR